jgi:cyanophycinase-like exopeptidase
VSIETRLDAEPDLLAPLELADGIFLAGGNQLAATTWAAPRASDAVTPRRHTPLRGVPLGA